MISFSGKAQFNGELDSTYAQNGISLIDFNQETQIGVCAKFHSNGKLYLGGITGSPNINFLLTRLNANGTVDNAFGNQGLFYYDFSIGGHDYLKDMDIFPNGKIVMVGSVPNGGTDQVIALVNANGSYDTGFNKSGFLITGGNYMDSWQTCLAEPNNQILVAGIHSDSQQQDIKVARYNSDGALDQTFGTNGDFSVDFSDGESSIALHRHSNNEYYLLIQTSVYKYSVIGFDKNGQPLANFASNGTMSVSLPNTSELFLTDIITDAQGNLYVLGGYRNAPADYKAMVHKFDNTGSVVNTFGVNGKFVANLSTHSTDYINSGKILANGSLLLAGVTDNWDQNMMNFLLAPDGSLISSYGQNGIMEYKVQNNNTENNPFLIEDASGRIFMCATSAQSGTKSDMVVAKLKGTSNVGIEEWKDHSAKLNLYPNPTSGLVSIDISDLNSHSCKAQFFDLQGKLMLQADQNSSSPTITADLSALPAGIYIIQISNGQFISSFKVQKL